MKKLTRQIVTSLGLALMAASLVALSPDQAQANVKKHAGNSAKVKSQAKRLSVRNGNKFMPEIGDEALASHAKRLSVRKGNDPAAIQTSSQREESGRTPLTLRSERCPAD